MLLAHVTDTHNQQTVQQRNNNEQKKAKKAIQLTLNNELKAEH